MNPWARRHLEVLSAALDDGETLLGANRVTLVSASKVEVPERTAIKSEDRPAIPRLGFRRPPLLMARASGIDVPGKIFILGLSDRRLLIWKSTPMLAMPAEIVMSYPLDKVASIRRRRRIGAGRVSIVLDGGALLVVQALWSRGIRELATAFTAARS